jgi:hypothetical protein
MDEAEIKRLYIEKPDEEVKLLCSHATRYEGFLDILLSGLLLSSEEAKELLGTIKTHRGSSMTRGKEERYYDTNKYISFSTGFVSFKYSDHKIRKREDYVGGLGIIVPLDNILNNLYLGFSHCSRKGGIKDYKLNEENIVQAVHMTRKSGELYDDGYGNLFEVSLWPQGDEIAGSYLPKAIAYPHLNIKDEVVVAIPEFLQQKIIVDINARQEEYKRFLDKISNQDPEKLKWKTIDGRDLDYVERMIPFMDKMVEPFEIDSLPVAWYDDRNMDIFLQRLAIQ